MWTANDKTIAAACILGALILGFVLSAGVDNYKLCSTQKKCQLPSNGTIWRLEHGGKIYRRLVLITEDQFEAIKAAKRSPSPAQAAAPTGPVITIIIGDGTGAEANNNAPPPQTDPFMAPPAPQEPMAPSAENAERLPGLRQPAQPRTKLLDRRLYDPAKGF